MEALADTPLAAVAVSRSRASLPRVVLWIEPRSIGRAERDGAVDRNRTGDLLLTMEMLYQLSYNGIC